MIIKSMFVLLLTLSVFPSAVSADEFGEENQSVIDGLQDSPPETEAPQEDGVPDESDTNDPFDQDSTNEEDETEAAGIQDQNMFFLTMQLLLALGAVIFAIYAILKFINKRSQRFNSHRTIQTVGGAGVGQNKSVQLVRIGEKVLVVGVGDSVQLLKEIDDPEEVAAITEEISGNEFYAEPVSKLTSWLKKTGSRYSAGEKPSASNEEAFKDLLNREMQDVKKSRQKIDSAMEDRK
ncbi:flagellar biosynthetic protein FliO [Salisediminibacterium halotolerans]|uniref:flagellar biosynthetic protein FliO n=1 Tax=Salisediminibacterium halotolerans TaxID=517425 RepID=UPI000EB25515|nr:flagellar biosynthetic protein FliO [Salisediminibacterium halotolerans]RLJ74208.1 flagellar protein FliO/FliZ [Actinophytocola xinjiangensis]RPE87699.1 flagellar protein FliO/FliZ [Salisediminibacterium halotolerans]TWG35045.1 flagellar protein FliO/FliZ [Salisediminibacterium halotolerans]GEL06668.1 flagellar biosynthetic protein FliZ [Salisediminibacterium halotolerans]